jgi:hypothetical protein
MGIQVILDVPRASHELKLILPDTVEGGGARLSNWLSSVLSGDQRERIDLR